MLGFAAITPPFPAPTGSGDWQWVPMVGSKCMSGEETGVHLRYAANMTTTKLAIYLHGGGACFNTATCAVSSTSAHPGQPGSGGIFDATDARNPLRDYHWLSVPYCTGDVHVGELVKKIGLTKHHFNGRANLRLVVERAVATFPNVAVRPTSMRCRKCRNPSASHAPPHAYYAPIGHSSAARASCTIQ
jgi:hypothetical protein